MRLKEKMKNDMIGIVHEVYEILDDQRKRSRFLAKKCVYLMI